MPYELTATFEQEEWLLFRGVETGSQRPIFAVTTNNGESARLRRSWELRDELDPESTLRPLAYELFNGRHHLVLPDHGGAPLAVMPLPFDVPSALRAGAAIATALARFHARGFVHRDIKRSSILYDAASERAWLAGTGLSLRIARAARRNEPSERMVGTPAYMAPEQSGRVNWPVDARSDLYSLGVVLYQLLTGTLPFDDADALSLIHAHIARVPEPPIARRPGIPNIVSALVLRLLAKDPRERYQTAAGALQDLRRCLSGLSTAEEVAPFPLGERDIPDHITVPDRIFGRESELMTIERALDRVAETQRPALLLVAGSSGVGKSALVEEGLRGRVASGGAMSIAAGKLDALGRGTLLETFGRALATLLPEIHADAALAAAVRTAVAPLGRLLISILPELTSLFADEPTPPDLPPRESLLRFQKVVRSFVGAFARPARPLTLFIDDLQWVDAATLGIISSLLSDRELGPLLVIGAYRTGEIDNAHLSALEKAASSIERLTLSPLDLEDVTRLIASMVRTAPDQVRELAALVFQKTAGDPFFTIQFVLSLGEERLLSLDGESAKWRYDLAAVEARGFTDNVVEMMLAKVDRLPARARDVLVHLAFLGDAASSAVLAAALGVEPNAVHGEVLAAVEAGLVASTTSAYVFLHDRIRESAYAVFSGAARAQLHRTIGERLFAAQLPGTTFDIFRQLDRGNSVATGETRVRDATVALAAAKEAKIAAAYPAARSCLDAAAARLPEDAWTTHRRLAFDIEILRAECELFLGELATAAERLSKLDERLTDLSERGATIRLLMNTHLTMGRADLAVRVCQPYFRAIGINWPAHPTEHDIATEIKRMRDLIRDRSVKEMAEHPLIQDRLLRTSLDDLLLDFAAPALFSDRNLFLLSIFGTFNFSLEHGFSPATGWVSSIVAWIFTTAYDDPTSGRYFADLAAALLERFKGHSLCARTKVTLAHHVLPWTNDGRRGDALAAEALSEMTRAGELSFLAYVHMHMITHHFSNGVHLRSVEEQAAVGRGVAASANFAYAISDIDHQLTLVHMLRGQSETFGSLDNGTFEESAFEEALRSRPTMPSLRARYWIRKATARYFAGNYAEACAAADAVWPILWRNGGAFGPHFRENADYHLFAVLARTAMPDANEHRDRLEEHRDRYARWAATAPTTYASRAALIDAELARLDGNDPAPIYERAISLARESGFVHHEAVILEVAARYWADRGFMTFAATYRTQAVAAYRRWGADAKVQEMESRFPETRMRGEMHLATTTLEQPVDQLDLATALAVSETVSSELVHEQLVEKLLSMAVKSAGAERAMLLLAREGTISAEAEAITRADGVDVRLAVDDAAANAYCPVLVGSVVAAGAPIVIDDAAALGPFTNDTYVRQHRCRSLAAVPLTRRGRVEGVLYLENNLVAGAFTPRHLATLKLAASQAASALENARLYSDLRKARAAEEALTATREALAHMARVATLGELTASIAHEVAQPLAAIRISAASSLRWLDAGKTSEVAAAVGRVVRDADNAVEVVQRLRTLFKKQGTERGEIDLNDAVREVVALTRAEIGKHRIQSELQLAADSPRVCANRVQIQQVLMNLVLNAIQAMHQTPERERRLTISTAAISKGRVRTSIRDSGPGVSKENADTLFQPFFSTKRDGMGIGLSICRSILTTHDGEIWHAPNDGPGATFGFDLPSP